MARSTRKFVTLREAIELMRNGQSLAQMHVSGGGKAWFIARWSVAFSAPPMASPTASSSIIPAQRTGTDLPKTMCNGPSIPISVPKARRIVSAASADRACWSAKIAVWSVLAARPAGIADTCRTRAVEIVDGELGLVGRDAPTARSTIRLSAPAGTRC
jgi:hypothetical protein